MTTLSPALWLDLLGRPFRAGARGPEAFDCVGLILEIQRRLGRCTVRYNSTEYDLGMALTSWERTEDPQPGDGILIRSCDPPWHIGVVAGGGFMIHAHQDCGVVRERYDVFPWHKRIEGFYRWKAT